MESKEKEEEMTCDHCGKECDHLNTRQGFLTTFFIEWVCDECYRKLDERLNE